MPQSTNMVGIEEKVAFLSKPGAYPNCVRTVEAKQTHMSWVFLTETHAWKLKKPVRYEYLDFSTPEARKLDCEREVLLNRRLSASVYLDVIPLTVGKGGGLSIRGSGEPVDWLVKMRRLPSERMLDRAIAERTWTEEDLRKVGTLLGAFYKTSSPVETNAAQYCKHLSEEFHATCRELQRPEFDLPVDLVSPVLREGAGFIATSHALLEARVDAGKIIDAHGDLRAEHICLEPQPVVIDCLEFNARLRALDSASELAFLKLECERLGAIEVGDRIVTTCWNEMGDWPQPQLLQFYKVYHACVRAKLALWHLRDNPDNRQKWIVRATEYLHLALNFR